MSRLGDWFRKKVEKWQKRYYEGPEPPARLEDLVTAFAELHPFATRADWIRFASAHAGEAYRAGFTRGFEYVERDREAWFPDISPEDYADAIDPGWRESQPFRVVDPDLVVPEAFADADILEAEMQAASKRGMRGRDGRND